MRLRESSDLSSLTYNRHVGLWSVVASEPSLKTQVPFWSPCVYQSAVDMFFGNDYRNMAVLPDANTNVSSLTNLYRSRRTMVPSSGQIMNAHAFPHKGYAFIVVTLPMVELIWNLSRLLTASASVLQLLGLESETIDQESLQGLLFQIQLSFVIAHEYTHHIHQHLEDRFGGSRIWTEFPLNGTRGNLKSQAQELDADGYSTYLVLAYLFRGERRQSALELLAEAGMTVMEGDEPLLTIFFLAVLAFLCAFWRGDTVMASIHESTHPPAPIRIEYLFRVAEMWCGQNGSVPPSWFSPERSQAFFRAASEVIDENTRETWDTQMTFLRSAGVHQYDQQLFDMFEGLRRKQKRSEREDMTIRPYV